ncbi:MAG: B12-binding domain-containing radical SAM protein [bacterium]|nr:B12-binding domain-containing radical SAM protein [bacterium]
MKILLVYPKCPDTFWGFKYALDFISRKAGQPPLGLITVAAMLPQEWEKKLVDMNVTSLRNEDLEWADYVFISAMSIQKKSSLELIARCKEKGAKTVAGGPLFTADFEDFGDVDHLVLNEAEITLPLFLEDLENGCAKAIYQSDEFCDLEKSPLPLFELLDIKKYAVMNLQYSRGCPFDCEFCNISTLFGDNVRTKSRAQVIAELDALSELGYKGSVFFVDDNFIGNKKKLKKEILPAITDWVKMHHRRFTFLTETSVNLADDEKLMTMMVEAGFNTVFVGIETTNEESLVECGKNQNSNRDLLESVRKMQGSGLLVNAGFILGFDNDPPAIFEKMSEFIQNSGIVNAMIGLLNAPRNTRLYKRLIDEGRLVLEPTGDNTDLSMNFDPKLGREAIMEGYRKVIQAVYSPHPYYKRVKKFLTEFHPNKDMKYFSESLQVKAFLKSVMMLGIMEKGRRYYWQLFFWTLFRRPKLFPMAMTFAVYGFHFRKYFYPLM